MIRKNIEQSVQQKVDALIRKSIEHAFSNYPALNDYIRAHAQEMSEDVMRQHIELYVNEFSIDLAENGRNAIKQLMRVHERGKSSRNDGAIFLKR